jgi:methyl-accepting chemotaxis protein
MDNNNGQQETAVLVAQALEDFRKGMEYCEQPSIRIGRRPTQIIRFGMTGLSILGLILFYLVFILTKDFSEITGHMTAMSGYMNSMEQEFASVAGLNTDLHAIVEQIQYMNGNVAGMANSVQVMNNQINNMNLTMGNMAENMHHLSKPMKAFPI